MPNVMDITEKGVTCPGPAPTIGALLAIVGAGPGVGGAVEGGAWGEGVQQ